MKTVITYQSFGYGPVMKVIKFLIEAKSQLGEVVLLANTSDKHIIEPNHHLFESVPVCYYTDSDEKVACLETALPFDQIIAFNDFESIVWGYFNGIQKRLAVDGLFHLWLINEDEIPAQRKLFDAYSKTSFQYMYALSRELLKSEPHKAIIWKHYFATHSFVGNYKNAKRKVKAFTNHGLMRLAGYFDFMPFPDEMMNRQVRRRHSTLLVNFGGGRYPTMTLDEEKTYCTLAATVTKDYVSALSKIFDFATKIVAVHPDLLGHVSSLFKDEDYIVLKSLSMPEYTKILNLAEVIIAAPGNTAVFEAAYHGKPVFLLPEKHIEQINFTNLVKSSFVHASLYEQISDKKLAVESEHGSVRALMDATKVVLSNPSMSLVDESQVANFAENPVGYIDGQKAKLHEIYSKGNGAKQLVAGIRKTLHGENGLLESAP